MYFKRNIINSLLDFWLILCVCGSCCFWWTRRRKKRLVNCIIWPFENLTAIWIKHDIFYIYIIQLSNIDFKPEALKVETLSNLTTLTAENKWKFTIYNGAQHISGNIYVLSRGKLLKYKLSGKTSVVSNFNWKDFHMII